MTLTEKMAITITSFRVTNYRSIIDSGWLELSPDGVTVLVGQNESGKTSLLHALHSGLAYKPVTNDDKRIIAPEPQFSVKALIDTHELAEELTEFEPKDVESIIEYFQKNGNLLEISFSWINSTSTDGKIIPQKKYHWLTSMNSKVLLN